VLTPPEIARLLTRYLDAADAEQRAGEVAEDMAAVGFVLQEDRSVPPEKWQALGARPQAEYVLPKTEFDLNGKDPDKAMEGSLLTRGNLLRLSQAVGLGRKWLPGLWPSAFQHSLLRREHLDAINEVYWLKFWQGLHAVRRGPKTNAAEPDTDWQLTLRFGPSEHTVNLEVKRRTGNLNAWFTKGFNGQGRAQVEAGRRTNAESGGPDGFPAAESGGDLPGEGESATIAGIGRRGDLD
jgi:hypothetical protein